VDDVRLIYFAMTSLDGYIEDEHGKFDWAAPDEEVHAFVNDLVRPVDAFLYGRRMYETMVFWETATDGPEVFQDFAGIWRDAEKIVFSRTLGETASERTRIEPEFRPEAVREVLSESANGAMIGGAELAGAALAAGLVDEYHAIVAPYVAGGGKPALPPGMGIPLSLQDSRSFAAGMVYLRYRVSS
jgi:dihydrofolate reductase